MKKRILFCFAHPDDETFTVGGLLASLAKRDDVETIVYSATLGDAGKCGNPPVCTKEELPHVRKKELEQAAAILGVDHLVTDTYPDGKLPEHEDALVASVRRLIDEYQPKIVVTFPPHGISGHRDHQAIQRATYRAVTEAKETPVEQLYYVTVVGRPSSRYSDSIEKIDVIFSFGKEEAKKVQQALLAHRTQHLSVERVFPSVHSDSFHKFQNREYFILAWSKNGEKPSNPFA
jgi:LmbE family N-acetylglucosaminyl deacetylase